MHLKLGKSFPLLKFKPNVLEPLHLNSNMLDNSHFDINDSINTFKDLMRIDCQLAGSVTRTKQSARKYISTIYQLKIQQLSKSKDQLKKQLEILISILQKLEFENIEKNITELFKGPYGLYSLYRYVWSPDLLQLISKVKQSYQLKQLKQNDPQILIYSNRAEKYCESIQEVMHQQSKILLKQFVRQMYIIPNNWGIKLITRMNLQQKIINLFSIQNPNDILKQLIKNFIQKESNQISNFKQSFKLLFYFQLSDQFYHFLTFLKSILLNKVSGIFSGDYETWQQVYDICLKIYARKQNCRGKKGIQIDQLIQHQTEDSQFTHFLLKCNIQSVSLCSMNFYFKNCPKSVKNNLKPIIMQKIKHLLQYQGCKYYEDVIQYLQTQATQSQKLQIIDLIVLVFERIIQYGIKKEQLFLTEQSISDIFEYLLKNQDLLFKVINQRILQKLLDFVKKINIKLDQITYQNTIYFIYSFINTMLIQSYEQQFDFQNVRKQGLVASLIQQIIIELKKSHNLQVHEDACSIVLQWRRMLKNNDHSESESEQQQQKQDQGQQNQVQWADQILTLILVSGKDCDFKLEKDFNSKKNKQLIAGNITNIFKNLSDAQFEQRKQIQKYLHKKTTTQQSTNQKICAQSFLIMKGFKDRLLHQNILNLAIKIHPEVSFAQVALFGVQFLTFMSPTMIDDPLSMISSQMQTAIQPFDICDIVSGEQPILSMKLICKKLSQFQYHNFDFKCFEKFPTQLLKQFGKISNNRSNLAKQIVQTQYQLNISVIDQMQQFKKFLFYVELMTKVFNKLNEQSQKGIKQIKNIYSVMEKICFKIWDCVCNKIISSQIYAVCHQNVKYQDSLKEIMDDRAALSFNDCNKQANDFSQLTFTKLVKSIKLPYIDSILTQTNYITKTCQQFICNISKVLFPTSFKDYFQKLFNPLDIIHIDNLIKFREQDDVSKNYLFIGKIVKVLALIQFTCCSQQQAQNKTKTEYKQWSKKWRKNCSHLTQNLLAAIDKNYVQINQKQQKNGKVIQTKNLWSNVFLVHLKAQIIKILVPFMIKDTLKYPQQNPKSYNTQLQQTFHNFAIICQIIQKISPGEEDHLMTFLQIFEGFDIGSTESSKNCLTQSKTSQFLYKAIQTLLELVFKGIRVRSYHFYKFIKSYLKLTKQKQNYLFFNSVIAHYIQNLMKQVVEEYTLSQSIINFCDQNMNKNFSSKVLKRQNSNKEMLINQDNLKKSVNKIRFSKFIRFQSKFSVQAQKICVISMFINLFCRLNYKSLSEGIEKIWETDQMHLTYIEYLQKITKFLYTQVKNTDQKLLDIINVDCFGNLSIILRNGPQEKIIDKIKKEKQTQCNNKIIYSLLKLIKQVIKSNIRAEIKNSLDLPVKKIMSQIKNSKTPIQTIDFISEKIGQLSLSNQSEKQQELMSSIHQSPCTQILDMILTCYNIKLARGISGNVHVANLTYLNYDSELKVRVFENNMSALQKRMCRKQIRKAMHQFEKKQQGRGKRKSKRSSIVKNVQALNDRKGNLQMVQMEVNISLQSEKLMKQIISNFVLGYTQVYKKSERADEQDGQIIAALFNNLKILSVVTLNNPQMIKYLRDFRVEQANMTVYEVMMDASFTCLPIFAQLYLLFLKTNFGFVEIVQQKSCIMPNSFSIQTQIRQDLLYSLTYLLQNSQYSESLDGLIKTLSFITKIASCQSRPYFRCYKFGNICNKSYTQIQHQYQEQFFKQLVSVLKKGINKLNEGDRKMDKYHLKILALYQQTLTKVLKQYDVAWMKLNLDIKLKQIQNGQHKSGKQAQKIEQNSDNNKIEKVKYKAKQVLKQYKSTINHEAAEIVRDTNSFMSYSFDHEIINEEVYNIIHKLDSNITTNDNSLQMLQKMMEYSAKQTVWEGLPDQDTILLHYPSSLPHGSFGINLNINQEDTNPTILPLTHQYSISQSNNANTNTNLDDGVIESDGIMQQNCDGIVQDGIEEDGIVQDEDDRNTQNQYDSIIEGQQQAVVPAVTRSRSNGCYESARDCDGIVEDMEEQKDFVVDQQTMQVVDQLKQCMSQTSLQFLSQHSVTLFEQQSQESQKQDRVEYTKQHLLQLYEQSAINPQARKQLLSAISTTDVQQLQKFIANQQVDQQIQMLIVRELWSRGVVPSATSISRNNRYYGGLVMNENTVAKCLSLHVNQAVVYKKMYDSYNKQKQFNPTQLYVPTLSKQSLQQIILQYFITYKPQTAKDKQNSLWFLLNKLMLHPLNAIFVIQIVLTYLGLSDSQFNQRIHKKCNTDIKFKSTDLKIIIIDDLLSGCIQHRVCLSLILIGFWDSEKSNIAIKNGQKIEQQNKYETNIPILQYILKQLCSIEKILTSRNVSKDKQDTLSTQKNVNGLIQNLWAYLQKCDQFKVHSKFDNNKQNANSYPYYQIQQTIKVSENVVRKMVDRLFNAKKVVGTIKNTKRKGKQGTSLIQDLFMILVYLDPTCFQIYFKTIVQKMSQRLIEIIKKQQKILTNFQTSWQLINDKNSTYSQMEKQEKYWNLRQSKKSILSLDEDLQYFRNLLVDISINLLPQFKKIRFNYHCGKNYRQWKLQIQILKQKLLTYGSVEGLVKLLQKQRDLEDWRRNQSNQIISQQIIPIIQQHSEQFLNILIEAEIFINEFIETFQVKQQKEKIVIYNSCAKLYEILLASEILTHQQKPSYHSMSKLKTSQSLESSKNVSGLNRRKSSLQNRKSARLSLSPCLPKVDILLRKIGPSCTFLNNYLGIQEEIRQLHAKYSDVNKRLRVLWANRNETRRQKPQKQKVIQCRRTHILQDTLAEIDDDFINLPVKIKFQGEIGIDYGGVTRQWITLFMKQIINPDLGLFSLSANKLTFQPNRNSDIIPNHLRYFRKIGIVVGKAMKQNWLLEVNLTKSFLKHLLGSTLYIEDLEDIDPQTAKSLKWILQNDIGYDDILGLNFTYEIDKLGKKHTIQLMEGGSKIAITEQNKKQYVKMVANMKMTEQIRQQSKAFMNGIQAVIPYSTLSLFSYKEISLYLSGMPTIDINQMRSFAKYENFTAENQQIVWFWEILSGWNQQQLANFLFFLTGSYKVPYGGFKQHPVGFNKLVSCTDYLPVAHTCFSVIDLSIYSSKQKMEKLLKKSIKEGKGFSVS